MISFFARPPTIAVTFSQVMPFTFIAIWYHCFFLLIFLLPHKNIFKNINVIANPIIKEMYHATILTKINAKSELVG
jgi:hypothetical protein